MRDENLSISELLVRTADGDETAFAQIHQHYWNEVYALALAFLKSPALAEDIIQEVFIKLWLKRTQLTEIQEFTPYLMVMVRNEIISHLRKAATRQKQLEQYSNGSLSLQELPAASITETTAVINSALASLPPKQQQIFAMSREQGLSHEAIAAQTGLSKKTVANTITIALNAIRTYLHRNGYLYWTGIPLLIKAFQNF
ncbi:RNA polymerase sigma-70 factor, ECF subfamily [Chitinophaga jiangningensis]|uniref:RNA polymerase sigma-70 factor, ECF subfamily n=1 Tax=Chitinophaga jiangningensis TaxID=1419482 RepID=A0A1M7FJG4_9BACT|nr:RNA polymerase sigma-70 factor [Chitinophaga jiangningensis]SHM03829.1 RNA polymerase sigma-70 factor, ECF subfamily [Chitinophaga jiangningensis]